MPEIRVDMYGMDTTRNLGWASTVLLIGMTAGAAFGQIVPPPYNKGYQWLAYSSDHAVTQKWAAHLDGGYRLMSETGWQQYLIRPGVNYQLSRTVQVSFAYAYFKTFPGGIGWEPGSAPEHRLHQQIQMQQTVGRLQLRHRYRIEQRFLGSGFNAEASRTWKLQHRVRYMVRTDIPLKKAANERTVVYLGLYNEFMLRFGNVGASSFDQNRIYAGLGFRPAKTLGFECGVMNQRYQQSAGGTLENNYILVATVTNTLPLAKLLGYKKH